jgi:putative heme iron utilization protein
MSDALLPVITPRGLKIEPEAGKPFEAIKVSRTLLHTSQTVALGTTDPTSGYPYTTVTNLAVEPDGTPLFFTANLTIHARNIEADNRISLTVAPFGKGDVLTLPRLTVVGRAYRITEDAALELAKSRYLSRYPKAKLYLALPDVIMYRMVIEGVQINGGPSRNANNMIAADIYTDWTGADDLSANQDTLIQKLNEQPEVIQKLVKLTDSKGDNWRATLIDPGGVNLSSAKDLARFWFETRITSAEALEEALKRL